MEIEEQDRLRDTAALGLITHGLAPEVAGYLAQLTVRVVVLEEQMRMVLAMSKKPLTKDLNIHKRLELVKKEEI
jgi:hypothetical protein